MEILSTNYNCRNRFVAGFISPILNCEDQVDGENQQQNKSVTNKKNRKSNKNLNILIANDLASSFINSSNNQLPGIIYKIDVTKVICPLSIYTSRLNQSDQNSLTVQTTKGKNALRNKKKKEAVKRKRELKCKNEIKRNVNFPPEGQIAVFYIVEEDESFKEYRKKFWENFAIDNMRFKHRCEKLKEMLSKVFETSHRNKIYKERFDLSEDSGTENDLEKDNDRTKVKKYKLNRKDDLISNNDNDNNTSESGIEQETEEESEFENGLTSNTEEENNTDSEESDSEESDSEESDSEESDREDSDDDNEISFSFITWTTN